MNIQPTPSYEIHMSTYSMEIQHLHLSTTKRELGVTLMEMGRSNGTRSRFFQEIDLLIS